MIRVRKDVWALGAGWNDTLLWYARGVRALQSRPLTDPTSWWFLAAIHGIHPVVWQQFGIVQPNTPAPPVAVQTRYWNQCQHQSWYFLPWHRGYLSAFEQIVLDAVITAGGPNDWALPYWNYSDANRPTARTMHDAFDALALPDGTANPLRVVRRFGDGTTPIQLDPSFVSLEALESDVFAGGDSDIPPGFGGPETLFHHGPELETTNGSLESLPHNIIHGAIGGVAPGEDPNDWRNFGLMSMPMSAALDPIFWLHHANIDRLWSAWLRDAQEEHVNPEELTWLDGPADREFVMPQINQGEWTFVARDVLDSTALPLEYSYDDETPPIFEARVERRMKRLQVPVGAGGAREDAGVASEKKPELIGGSDAPVRVTGSTGASVRLDAPATRTLRSGLESVTAPNAGTAAEPARVFLKLENIRGTSDAAIYHVYVGLPANADPAEHADRRVGTISLFGVSAASDPNGPTAGSGLNQVMEISEVVDALHLSGDDLNRLDVRFVPAAPSAERATFSVGRMSVFKLGD